ncbi:hypothetical protein M378DRAFT_68218 [Amanita muscaria Koide BX008]|uniref:JmjC domain-containing protein n=1 Tax=Amanita muscaria (strain Koide BX008) TaxID=946122 RepID=A0A0C2XLU1_AMAMK|nr:hypothetical protein M378DRAFT_68218 [Amanita muscaria Koide BX008]
MPPSTVDPVQWLAREYYELNGSYIEILDSPPTALGFSRLVHISRPVIIKALHIPASLKWTDEYLVTEMGAQEISVAATPNGRADAVTEGPDGSFYFAEPYVDKMTMSGLLSKLTAVASDGPEVHYLQSQNGNLYGAEFFQGQTDAKTTEFELLRKDVPSEVSWASKALDRSPDAVNVWIGNGKSITSVHSDPYENLYTVVRGAKHFTLLPPTEGRYLNEKWYPHARYTRSSDGRLELTPSKDAPPVRWSSILEPHLSGALPAESHPIHVTLLAGESLYLPAGWWHHVRQAAGVTIAVNWWYDMEMRGVSWVMLSFMRKFGPAALDFDDNEEEGAE